jgi:hypothetical protein
VTLNTIVRVVKRRVTPRGRASVNNK